MEITEIIYVAGVIIAMVGAVVSTVMTVTTKKKGSDDTTKKSDCIKTGTESSTGTAKNIQETVESLQCRQDDIFWLELCKKLPEYISQAEYFYKQIVPSSTIKTGTQKLSQVLDKVKIDCLTSNVTYDEEKATKMVNELVEFTNEVNTNK